MGQISDLNDLRLFAEVVDRGGFSAAARALGLQTSKLSRRVRALEEELGVRLLNRTSRSVSLTETGRLFHQHCVALVTEAKVAKEIVEQTRSTPSGTVRISCPVALLSMGIAELIAQYVHDNPQVQVLIDATNRSVDVIEEGLDFAIRVRLPPLEDTDLAVRSLGVSLLVLVAAPSLVAQFSRPTSLDSLQGWPTLALSSNSERYVWSLVDAEGKASSLTHHPCLATDDMASLRIAAIVGAGVAFLPFELVDDDIRAGRLERLLPHLTKKPGLVHALFPTRRGMVPAVRQLLDALVAGYSNRHQQPLTPQPSG